MLTITDDQFDDAFTIVPDQHGEEIRHEEPGVPSDSKRLWTVLDVDGALWLASGHHVVNAYGFVVTKQEWAQETELLWAPADPEAEDQREDG